MNLSKEIKKVKESGESAAPKKIMQTIFLFAGAIIGALSSSLAVIDLIQNAGNISPMQSVSKILTILISLFLMAFFTLSIGIQKKTRMIDLIDHRLRLIRLAMACCIAIWAYSSTAFTLYGANPNSGKRVVILFLFIVAVGMVIKWLFSKMLSPNISRDVVNIIAQQESIDINEFGDKKDPINIKKVYERVYSLERVLARHKTPLAMPERPVLSDIEIAAINDLVARRSGTTSDSGESVRYSSGSSESSDSSSSSSDSSSSSSGGD